MTGIGLKKNGAPPQEDIFWSELFELFERYSHSTEFEAFLRGFQRKNPSVTAFGGA